MSGSVGEDSLGDRIRDGDHPQWLVLVKHALPVLDAAVPPADWRLSPEGEQQSIRLASRLAKYGPLRVIASPEPKALATGRIVAAELGLDCSSAPGLEEFDRPALPLVSKAAHERVNAAIFADVHARVLGAESGIDARERFSTAIRAELARSGPLNLVAITHGTVIALFVAAHNEVDGFGLWKQLACPSIVVLSLPCFSLREVISPAG